MINKKKKSDSGYNIRPLKRSLLLACSIFDIFKICFGGGGGLLECLRGLNSLFFCSYDLLVPSFCRHTSNVCLLKKLLRHMYSVWLLTAADCIYTCTLRW